MDTISKIISELNGFNDNKKGETLLKFFQVFPGGYGEGDSFIGVSVPNQRLVAKNFFREINLNELESLLNGAVHEYRLTALFMLPFGQRLLPNTSQQVFFLRTTDVVVQSCKT